MRSPVNPASRLRPGRLVAGSATALAAFLLAATPPAFGQETKAGKSTAELDSPPAANDEVAVMDITIDGADAGQIVLKFFPDAAPKHVENFKKIARAGTYDGVLFHRVIPNFMIQGGDPNAKAGGDRSKFGQGGPGWTIPAEFNDHPHKRGTLSMARTNDPNSAGSQFFICVADAPFLDHQYTVFGHVVSGMDVADKIVNLQRDSGDCPLKPAVMKKVTIMKFSEVPKAGKAEKPSTGAKGAGGKHGSKEKPKAEKPSGN